MRTSSLKPDCTSPYCFQQWMIFKAPVLRVTCTAGKSLYVLQTVIYIADSSLVLPIERSRASFLRVKSVVVTTVLRVQRRPLPKDLNRPKVACFRVPIEAQSRKCLYPIGLYFFKMSIIRHRQSFSARNADSYDRFDNGRGPFVSLQIKSVVITTVFCSL